MKQLAVRFELTGQRDGGHNTTFQPGRRHNISRSSGQGRHHVLIIVDQSVKRRIGKPLPGSV